MKTIVRLPLVMGALLVLPFAAQAQFTTVTGAISFDEVLPGTVINTTYDSLYHLTFAGTSANPNNNGIQAIDTVSLSAPNSLDATTSGNVLVTFSPFAYPNGVDAFSIYALADPAGYGSTGAVLKAFDKNGTQIGSLPFNGTQSQSLSLTLSGVQSVLLPADTYYDNLRFTGQQAVPEPGVISLLGAGILAASAVSLRRKNRR